MQSIRLLRAVLVACCFLPSPSTAQDQQLQVIVVGIAGSNIYLDAGRDRGLVEGDTVVVRRADLTTDAGLFVVIGSSSDGAVVTFAGEPFPITRGEVLVLQLGVDPARATDAIAAAPPGAAQRRGARQGRTPRLSGRITLEASGLRSTTLGLGADPIEVERTFATPVFRLRATASDLPGGFRFNTHIRLSARLSTDDAIQPVQSARIYRASIAKAFDRLPLQFEVGRFYNTAEHYSGYWDGAMVRVGRGGFGVGALFGVEPERANERIDTNAPKFTAFADYTVRKPTFQYHTDLSIHRADVRDGDLPIKTFVGWSQDLGVGPLRVSQRLQVDRDPETNQWALADLRLHASVAVARGVYLRGGYSDRRPSSPWRSEHIGPYRREQATAGLTLTGPIGSFSVNTAGNRIEGEDISWSYGSSFSLARLPVVKVGLAGSGRYWRRPGLTGVFLTAGVHRALNRMQWRASYQYNRTEATSYALTTHAGEFSLLLPLAGRLYSSIRVRSQFGDNLTSNSVFTSLWMSF